MVGYINCAACSVCGVLIACHLAVAANAENLQKRAVVRINGRLTFAPSSNNIVSVTV
jgi:hypothetical protein